MTVRLRKSVFLLFALIFAALGTWYAFSAFYDGINVSSYNAIQLGMRLTEAEELLGKKAGSYRRSNWVEEDVTMFHNWEGLYPGRGSNYYADGTVSYYFDDGTRGPRDGKYWQTERCRIELVTDADCRIVAKHCEELIGHRVWTVWDLMRLIKFGTPR